MENEVIIDECRITKHYEDSQGDTIWRIHSLKNIKSEFLIHVSRDGRMYITHFPECEIPFKSRKKIIRELCKTLKSQGYSLQIMVKDNNIALKNLCLQAGFRHMYHKNNKSPKKRFSVFYFP